MSNYAKIYVDAKLQAAAANINSRIQEITSQTGIEFGSFFSDAMSGSYDTPVKTVDGLALAQSMGLGSGDLTSSELEKKIEDMKKQFLKTDKTGSSSKTGSTGANVKSDPSEYDDIIAETALRYGLNPTLIKAIVYAESSFNADCLSKSGAMGLMQLMPSTAEGLGVTDAFDPEQNIDGGTRYILAQLQRFGGDVKMALAAYNCGPGGVTKRGITDLNDPNQMSLLPSETQKYIANIERYLTSLGAEELLNERMGVN